ncbi:phage terminase large subunit [Peribacillus frigoritolerans]|uniref:phage terminase large subunit n=1 Tax=Peribacillus frigoritolerans TaxID=450367 RepID=UPI0021D37D82|nr:phage terminase large subunit [Peribacillus frigoritolerans]MCU6603777.1 phage terminase large subunit [Peribacillus frigoritolerans]
MRALMRATIIENKYIPHDPTPKQAEFLLLQNREALYGGAAGGGKSDALLMAALQYVDHPKYAAILFRKSYADLSLPGALMDRAHEWLDGTDAKWNEKKKQWLFPKGATVTFAYLDHVNDRFNYQGSEFQFVGFDELTQFDESNYRYLFSRLRRLKGSTIPIRARSASNPGGKGHDWVKQRMLVEGESKGRKFIPATLQDNPYLDADEYMQSLQELDPLTREQLLKGDWDARMDGNKFKRSWFKIVDDYPRDGRFVRYWDLAATEPKPGKDPDWTAGALMTEKDGQYWIVNVVRDRCSPKGVEQLIYNTAMQDGRHVEIHMEQEPGSSGVNTIDHYQRNVLRGFTFYGNKVTGNKELRANPVSSAAEAGNIFLVRGEWINDFVDEAIGFPGNSSHDDMVDAVSGAFDKLFVRIDMKHAVRPVVAGLRKRG